MGYEKDDLRRCQSGIIYTLNQLANEGHVYAEEEQLVKAAIELLEADESPIREALRNMLLTDDLKQENEAIYLPPFYYAEAGTANRLLALLRTTDEGLFTQTVDVPSLSKETGIAAAFLLRRSGHCQSSAGTATHHRRGIVYPDSRRAQPLERDRHRLR